MNKALDGFAHTVLGPISPENIGMTSTHEHILIDFLCMFQEPQELSQRNLAFQQITMQNLNWVRYNMWNNHDNLQLTDEDTAVEEINLFKKAGGSTIVDATTIGINRNPEALVRISSATGINIIMGAGYYVDSVHPSEVETKTVSELTVQITSEILEGISPMQIKAGIIGEIGCSWPLTKNEQKILQASAQAQNQTGAPILIHPGRNEKAPLEILNILENEGACSNQIIMSHMDRTFEKIDSILEFAQKGSYLEYDLFGWETSYYPLSPANIPTDAKRLEFMKELIDNGFSEKLVIGQDIFSKHRLTKYGGQGYSHIIKNIIPRMKDEGFTDKTIQLIFIDNPKRILTFSPI